MEGLSGRQLGGVVAVFLGVLLLVGGAEAASFDCKKAVNRIERLICDTPNLSSFDSQLEGAYRGALDRSVRPATVKTRQQAWLEQRDACLDVSCLSKAYEQQIQLLMKISDEPALCERIGSTRELDACAAEYSRRADRQLARYVDAARQRLIAETRNELDAKASKTALETLDASQAAWVTYREAECSAVYTWFGDGTIRGFMYEDCWRAVTVARAVTVWSNWLQYMDSTPPLLVKPTDPRD